MCGKVFCVHFKHRSVPVWPLDAQTSGLAQNGSGWFRHTFFELHPSGARSTRRAPGVCKTANVCISSHTLFRAVILFLWYFCCFVETKVTRGVLQLAKLELKAPVKSNMSEDVQSHARINKCQQFLSTVLSFRSVTELMILMGHRPNPDQTLQSSADGQSLAGWSFPPHL